jgi:MFS transporter, PAT family, solute carrier family 33 (acetyl-CoA transportor), member 1
MPKSTVSTPAISTTLDSIQITPRTPRVLRSDHADVEEVEMSLLDEDDRKRADAGFVDGNGHIEAKPRAPLSSEDKRAMVLLCILCMWLPSP